MAAAGHQVVVAGNQRQQDFVMANAAHPVAVLSLEGYNVRYNKSGGSFMFTLLKQIPHIHKRISQEHEWLLQEAKTQKIDGIISDNRYGLYHPKIPSVIMTHQLQLQTHWSIAESFARKLHYKYLNKFDAIWVPDVIGKPNLSGKLGHPDNLPENVQYLGLLSHLKKSHKATNAGKYLLILLSGPEPQRSILSAMLWQQAMELNEEIVFIEGSNTAAPPENIPGHIRYYKQVDSVLLQTLLNDASIVICRSGYSTLMDLATLGKKAILIPTPGQTEQEYLGTYLHKQGIFFCARQKQFNLLQSLNEIANFPFNQFLISSPTDAYKQVLDKWVKTI